ncbi:MAG TPA: tetratricopeptide repeat protein, partial [Actinomycetota bacterium]
AGRATLEGVLLQTAVNSPFIYWIQSQISKQGTGVIPGYSYPAVDPVRGTKRLELYNAHDIITNTPEVQKALDGDPRWTRTFRRSPYAIYHLKDADPHYVRVPKFQPVLVDPKEWKHAFHAWFSRDELLDVPLVLARTVPPDQRRLFPLTSPSTTDLPRQPIGRTCEIDEQLDHMEIRFTTTCPGVPHWIAVSYFPNWQVEGAPGVHLASPAFMMVVPERETVVLRFRRIGADWLGIAATLAGLVLLVVAVPAPARAVGAIDRGLHAAHPFLVPIVIVLVVGMSVLNAARDFGPQWFYKRGWAAFSSNDYEAARREFEWAIRLGGDSNTAADATFFRAASLFRTDRFEEAMEGYQRIPEDFPHSIWVAESIYHVGLCLRRLDRIDEAIARFRHVVETYPSDRWAGFSREQLQQLGAAE